MRGIRGGFGSEGVDGHDVSEHLAPSRGRLAAQKKSPMAQERDEEARGLWRWLAARFDARRLVFVEESGFNTSMTRLRSRAPRGERAYGRVPRNRGKNQTLIASISLKGGMGEAISIEGGTDAEVLETYVRDFLAPSLEAGQVVVMDKLGAHRSTRVKELIEARGCDLVLMPSYSPDLNPIEEAFSKIKSIVRKAGARTRELLDEAMGEAMSAVRLEDVLGWFTHCGYAARDQYS